MNYWVKIQFNALIFYTNYDFFCVCSGVLMISKSFEKITTINLCRMEIMVCFLYYLWKDFKSLLLKVN